MVMQDLYHQQHEGPYIHIMKIAQLLLSGGSIQVLGLV